MSSDISDNTVFVGIDPSLHRTAVVVLNRQGMLESKLGGVYGIELEPMKSRPALQISAFYMEGLHLLHSWLVKVISAIEKSHECIFGLEATGWGGGYAIYHSEWGGIIKMTLKSTNRPVYVIPPSSLKKFVTGDGNADKEKVWREVSLRWEFEPMWKPTKKKEEMDFDRSDAYGLAQLSRAIHLFLCSSSEVGEHFSDWQIQVVKSLVFGKTSSIKIHHGNIA